MDPWRSPCVLWWFVVASLPQKERGRLGPPLSPTLKIVFCKNFPAHSTDPWFQTKTAHDVFQQRVLTIRAGQHRSNFDLISVVNTVAFQRLEEQRLSAQGFAYGFLVLSERRSGRDR